MVIWQGIVYRFTIILYSRASCSYWCVKNRKARQLRRILRSYKIETNGYVDYRSFILKSRLGYTGRTRITKGGLRVFWIKPCAELLTEGFLSDTPDSVWKGKNHYSEQMQWLDFPLVKNKPSPPTLKVVFVPEFQDRSAYVSVFACAINDASDRVTGGLSKKQVLELVYVALLSTSNLTFFYIVQEMCWDYIRNDRDVCLWVHPFFYFKEICHREGLKMRGGRNPRIQGQTDAKLPTSESELLEQLNFLDEAVTYLNNGELLNSEGVYVHDAKVYSRLNGVGNVAALSFASLCCFVGLGTTKYAIQTAKQAPLNNSSTNNYFDSMIEALRIPGDQGLPPRDTYYYLGMLKAIATSVGVTPATIENSICSRFRKGKRFDNFIFGQDMYGFSTTDHNVYFKKFGTVHWIVKQFRFNDC